LCFVSDSMSKVCGLGPMSSMGTIDLLCNLKERMRDRGRGWSRCDERARRRACLA
jgi:hypothetical protein